MHACFSCVWFFATLCTVSCQAPLLWGFSRQKYWSGLPYPPPGNLSNLGIKPGSLTSFALAGMFFTTSTTWESRTDCIVLVQSLSRVRLFATPWITANQASLSITSSQSSSKPMSTESVMPSSHLILSHPLLFLSSVFPSIRVFPSELACPIRWPKYWSFSFSVSPPNKHSGLISFRIN